MNSRVKKIGVSEIRKSAGHFSDSFTQRTSAAYFSGRKVGVESGAKIRIHVTITAALYQKLPFPHHLLAVEPDVEIPADAVDMRFGSPVRASVLGVGMTKRDVDSGNFFVL